MALHCEKKQVSHFVHVFYSDSVCSIEGIHMLVYPICCIFVLLILVEREKEKLKP